MLSNGGLPYAVNQYRVRQGNLYEAVQVIRKIQHYLLDARPVMAKIQEAQNMVTADRRMYETRHPSASWALACYLSPG